MAFELVSPGAMGLDAFTKSMLQQEQLKRQKMLDDLNRQNIQSTISERAGRLDVDRQNAQSMAGFRQAQVQDDLARAQQIRAQQDQDAKDAKAENAFGMWLDQNPDAKEGDMRKFLVNAGMSMSKVNATVKNVADIARDKARLKLQENSAHQASQDRLAIAQLTADTRRDVANAGIQARKEAADAKAQASFEKDRQAAAGVLDQADSIDKTISQLMTKNQAGQDMLAPGVDSIVGGLRVPAFISHMGNLPGMKNADKQAALDRLSSQLIVNLITEMKQASKTGATGFGQLSDREGRILESAAAQLSQAQSEPQFLQAMKEVRDSINRIRAHAQDRMKSPAMNGGTVTIDSIPGAAPKPKSKYIQIKSSIEG